MPQPRPDATYAGHAELVLVADMDVPHGDLQVVNDLSHERGQEALGLRAVCLTVQRCVGARGGLGDAVC